MTDLYIHPDIRKASTLPAQFYRSESIFQNSVENIFSRCWLYAMDAEELNQPGRIRPLTLLSGVLDEPLVFTRDKNEQIHCLSNVCTHRGNLVATEPGNSQTLRCGYHGRCFHLDGTFKSMPAFEQVENFPGEKDHLPAIPFAQWLGMLFVSMLPAVGFEEVVRPIRERLSWLPLETLDYVPEASATYSVNAHWALYCDNYLEGFHIPFVHPALNKALDFKAYGYELFPFCNLQIGIAGKGEACFDIPEKAMDFGKKVYAYYWWVFPNLMFNFYPWGLSLNIVNPVNHQKTQVEFRTYRFRDRPFDREVNNLHLTELEDEAVVENVQRGIQSRFYDRGRYSPTMEQGVHHFHRLIAQFFTS